MDTRNSEEPKGILVVLAGPPGCGKSSLADILSGRYAFQIVSSDSIRGELFGDENCQSNNAKVFDVAHGRASDLLAYTNVVFDATSCKSVYRREILKRTSESRKYAICVMFDDSLESCLERNSRRARKVPDDVVKKMRDELWNIPPSIDEGFDRVTLPSDAVTAVEEAFAIFSEE